MILGLKLAVSALLVGWMLRAGTLDFGALRLFVERPELLVANLGVLSFSVLLGALRWRLLLRMVEIRIPLGRALQLHLTGLFFNIVIPGSIGGDIVKSVYVAREEPVEKRPAVYLIALVDRLTGVASLTVVAFIVTLARGAAAWEAPHRELSIVVAVLAVVTLLAPILVLVLARRTGERASIGVFGRLVAATQVVAGRPGMLLAALALAITLHLSGMVLFATLATAITTPDVPLSSIASVYPLGMLTLVVPISTAGIGVGHVAFERLFSIVGLAGGATVFNLFLIGQTTPCLLGVLPYLTLRRRFPPPTETEAAAQQAGTGASGEPPVSPDLADTAAPLPAGSTRRDW